MTKQALFNHPQATKEDYEYFITKGYTHEEIFAFWNRDHAQGKPPTTVNKYKIDWTQYRANLNN